MLGARTGGQDHQGRPPPPRPPSWPRLSWSLPMGTQSSRPTALPAPSHAHSLPLCPRLPDAGLPAWWALRHRARSSRGLVARSRLGCRPGLSPTSKPQSHHAPPGTKRIPSPIGATVSLLKRTAVALGTRAVRMVCGGSSAAPLGSPLLGQRQHPRGRGWTPGTCIPHGACPIPGHLSTSPTRSSRTLAHPLG